MITGGFTMVVVKKCHCIKKSNQNLEDGRLS